MTKKEREFLGNNGRTYFELHFERENLIDRLEQWLNELKTPPPEGGGLRGGVESLGRIEFDQVTAK